MYGNLHSDHMLSRYLEINVAGFRKLLKRHEKQVRCSRQPEPLGLVVKLAEYL